ncbi:MAG: hypothetical protein CM15mP49_12610 [Actinomycetota bacterium]|nr:MAG: hypothetical protein CM15mP49_12610 [Actinomycetota bacterium]
MRKHDLETLDALLIIHDELDLKPGTLKVKLHGGLAGHNGLKSISKHLKSNDFWSFTNRSRKAPAISVR